MPSRARKLRADTVMVIEHVTEVAERNSCFDKETRMPLIVRSKSLFDKMERLVASSTTDQTTDPAELEEFLDQSVALATMIQENFSKSLKRNDRKVKQAGFIVLHQTFMPSVLVETGFLTNTEQKIR